MAVKQKKIKDSCKLLWPNSTSFDKLCLIVTDGAYYMAKAIRHIKQNDLMFKNVLHVKCLAHMMHNVSELIRNSFPLVDKYMSNMKKFLLKSHGRRKDFLLITKIDSLPPEPVLTRWGTWLKAAEYYFKNYDCIRQFILKYTQHSEAQSKDELDKLLTKQNDELIADFVNLSGFFKLYSLIEKLESRNLTIEEQYGYVNELQNDILDGNEKLQDYVKERLKNNPDIDQIMSKRNKQLSVVNDFKFAPLVSVDVERSFSLFKDLLTPKRTSLGESSLSQLMFLKYNRTM